MPESVQANPSFSGLKAFRHYSAICMCVSLIHQKMHARRDIDSYISLQQPCVSAAVRKAEAGGGG